MAGSLISQILEPGGGVMLLPFVRLVIFLLLILVVVAAIYDVARIHMIILSVLSSGLLISLSFFESEYKKMRSGGRSNNNPEGMMTASSAGASSTANKTD